METVDQRSLKFKINIFLVVARLLKHLLEDLINLMV
jgi:hypothetical protein